ncbi:MAG: hypothetical protein ABIK68_07485, partial [bacterium]
GWRTSCNTLRVLTGFAAGMGLGLALLGPGVRLVMNGKTCWRKGERAVRMNALNMMLFLLCLGLAMTGTSQAMTVTLKPGTPVPIRLEEEASSEQATAGQMMRFVVTRDVTVDGCVAIKAGSEVVGEVTHAQKTGSLGKEGQIHIMARHAVAVNGVRVPLRATLSQAGDEKVALSWMICPFIKGGVGFIPAGTETKAYVDYETQLEVP